MAQVDTKDSVYSKTPKARPRQAVVLIHGIGEQRPMATLRGFVHALLPKGEYYSKPDDISDSFERRRLKLRRRAEDEESVKASCSVRSMATPPRRDQFLLQARSRGWCAIADVRLRH